DGIVTQPGNPGEDLVRKLAVRMHAPFFPAHAYMRFIYERNFHPGRLKTVIPPFIRALRHPDLPGKIISGR
ncbi:hypothetical protein LJB63_28455, partial [[Eubacterium] rectale]|nr:hypothetical protein [Agathobacter rectalis]